MTRLKTFSYNDINIRTVDRDGEVWWVLTDVCGALGLSNPSVIADRLDDDERSKSDLGRQGRAFVINESGLYNVILRSDKPEAKAFKRWITHEVLPQIRKTGAYTLPERSLSETNHAAEIITRTLKDAGMTPAAIVETVQNLYKPMGVAVPIPQLPGQEMIEAKEIAKRAGIYSRMGNPHETAANLIIKSLALSADEKRLEIIRNESTGYNYTTWQYADTVVTKVRAWLVNAGFPAVIEIGGTRCQVIYR